MRQGNAGISLKMDKILLFSTVLLSQAAKLMPPTSEKAINSDRCPLTSRSPKMPNGSNLQKKSNDSHNLHKP